jgi:hypothetical protein
MNLLGTFLEDPQNYNMNDKIKGKDKGKGKSIPLTGRGGP